MAGRMITLSLRSYGKPAKPPMGFKPGSRFDFDVQEGTPLIQLIEQVLGMDEDSLALAAVNGRAEHDDYVLQAGDQVDLFPPISGN